MHFYPKSGHFSLFSRNTGKYGPEINPYLDTFHAVNHSVRKAFRNLILNLIIAGWKVIGYSKKKQIEDL